MEDIFSAFFEGMGIKNQGLQDALRRHSTVRIFKKGEKIFDLAHDVTSYVLKANGGIARAYHYNRDGKEITDCFDDSQNGCLNFTVKLEDLRSSPKIVEALTDFPTIVIPKASLEAIQEKGSEVLSIILRLTEQGDLFREELKQVTNECPVKDRVIWFNQRFSALNGLAQEQQIASYLNMSPVTLSRIRKELRKEQLTV